MNPFSDRSPTGSIFVAAFDHSSIDTSCSSNAAAAEIRAARWRQHVRRRQLHVRSPRIMQKLHVLLRRRRKRERTRTPQIALCRGEIVVHARPVIARTSANGLLSGESCAQHPIATGRCNVWLVDATVAGAMQHTRQTLRTHEQRASAKCFVVEMNTFIGACAVVDARCVEQT